MTERYGCMCGHKPQSHAYHSGTCLFAGCPCERYVEYDHSDDHYTGPRGREAEAEQRHSQAEIQRTLKR